MELNTAMQDALNEQIQKEFESAYLYLSMAAYFGSKNLPGFAQWMRIQAQEEVTHAMKLFDFVQDRNGRVILHALGQPRADFESAQDVFETAAAHERDVTTRIHTLYARAVKDSDYASLALLQWFITEQVEEERAAGDIVETLRRIGDSAPGLFMLDKELGKRGAAEA